MKKHAEDLTALQKKLVDQHEKDLKTAVDAAVEAAKKENPAAAADFDKQAVIDAAIAEYDAKVKAQHEAEIESAVERGRREQMTKGKLKDAQLAKAQKRVKDFEAQILEWKNTGVLPQDATVASTPAAPPAASAGAPATTGAPTPSAPSTSTPQAAPPASPATATPAAGATQPAANVLPRKPPMGTANPAVAARGGAPPLRGRGGLGRGAATRVPPVRATPAQQAAAAAASSNSPATSSGMSIMGAATKRPREEGAAAPEDSLAKRLKPSEGATKGPVQIRRPPPPGP